ncbi:MAG: endolytic transglycosylase MltG [Acidimicrobiia bacterium]
MLRAPMSGGGKAGVVVIGVLVVIVLIGGGFAFWVNQQIHPGGAAGSEVVLDVASGTTVSGVAALLEDRDVVTRADVFRWYAKRKGLGSVQAGSYNLRTNSDMGDVVGALKAGPAPPPSRRFTVTPGLKLVQIPNQVVAEVGAFSVDAFSGLVTANQVRSQFQPPDADLEGFLMPDTYEIAQGAGEEAALQAMVAQFDKVAAEVGLGDAEAQVGYSPYEVLIVASLVEREAKVDDDRSKVARVIYNRLDSGIPLGVDATLCYLEPVPCSLTQSELDTDGPYNTRTRAGLIPTPISNVSRASLEAALDPADGDWTFYVLDPDVDPNGNVHLFTDSAGEFEAAKSRCRAAGFGCG